MARGEQVVAPWREGKHEMTPGDARALAGQQLGAFQLEALLPIGGLPECFKARHVELGHVVAVKLLPGTLTGGHGTLTALREEARRISALKHPNILPIHGIAETQGILYAVTPLPTASLRDRLDREGLLPATQAVQLVAQLAWALHALHGIGLIHGDVQPGTLLFDADDTLQLADFGAARALARQRGRRSRVSSRTWPLAGARSYVAPEVAATGEISVRGDIYALGAVLYEMLIGTLPRQQATQNEPELVTAPLPASMRSSETWPELAAVALRALERDPAKRYPDARAFAIALRRAVIERPEPARGPSLRDALSGVWHPEAEEASKPGEVQAFKKKLATMPPAPAAASLKDEPALKEKADTVPPAPRSRPTGQTPARPVTQLPAATIAAEPDEDQIVTMVLPSRLAPPVKRPPAQKRLTEPPSHHTSPVPPGLPDSPTRPARLRPAESPERPLPEPPTTGVRVPSRGAPAAPANGNGDTDGYIAPAEMARRLAGQRPGRRQRLAAAVASLTLLLAFCLGALGILTGLAGSATAHPPASQTGATATAGVMATATAISPAGTVVSPQQRQPAPRPTTTIHPTSPRPSATH